ncbi:Tyrosine-protein kinase yes [Lamellibrachia satsuma]|nr:Tyrosine-protein kinase yes [Lamellibrachia satsuma]
MCIKPNKEERTDVAMNPIASSNSVASPGQVTVGMPPVPNKPLPPVPQKAKGLVVRALYSFTKLQDDDLTFKKGDRLELPDGKIGEEVWYIAKNLMTGEMGYIPSNYVVVDDKNPETQEWFFKVDRREAEKQLMLPGNPRGTFLVRGSADKKSYALSIQDYDEERRQRIIKHYRIRRTDNGDCYISPRNRFPTVIDLISHYSDGSDGLCCRLNRPCPREPQPIPFKDIEVDRNQIKLQRKLGAGQFGEVFAGKWCNQVDVAVKTMKEGQMSHEAFLDEAKIMHKLSHRKLVQLMGVCTQSEPLYIITELMINGALLDYLREASQSVHLMDLVDMAAQIADGMAYLEKKCFIHRDLRAANILVGENNIVKVADFGLARFTEFDTKEPTDNVYLANEATKFPIKWTAPEAAFERKFSTKSDVWSFGVLLYEITTYGRVPYPGMTGQEVLNRVDQGYRMPRPIGEGINCPEPIYETMQKCWDRRPDNRPSFEYLYSFFDDYLVAADSPYRETY